MIKPQRIQRKRTKGWRMPAGAVSVCRPGKWGNPFRAVDAMLACDASHRRTVLPSWVLWDDTVYESPLAAVQASVDLCREWITGTLDNGPDLGIVRPCLFTLDDIRRELAGEDLACWCRIGAPCHADVLLEVANDC